MLRVRERRPEPRIQAQVKAQKEEKVGRGQQGGKASRKGAKERTRKWGLRHPCLSSLGKERQETPKKTLLPLALAFLEQIQIDLRDRFQNLLHLSERLQTLLHLFLPLTGDGDRAHLPIAGTDGENPNRPVAYALAFLAKPAPGLIAAHHAAQ